MNPWIPIVISLLAGGTAGAVNYFIHRRGRKQPIGYNISLTSIHNSQGSKPIYFSEDIPQSRRKPNLSKMPNQV